MKNLAMIVMLPFMGIGALVTLALTGLGAGHHAMMKWLEKAAEEETREP